MHVIRSLPRVIRRGIALPFDEILELTPTPIITVIDDGLDFVFFLAFDQIRWWPREVGAVRSRFFIRQQERSVEHVVDVP